MADDDKTVRQDRKDWDALQGRGNETDYDRAVFLRRLFRRFGSADGVKDYLVGYLGEHPGKNLGTHVRLLEAFQADSRKRHWKAIGSGMVLFVRIAEVFGDDEADRVWALIRDKMSKSGRRSISPKMFRELVREDFSPDDYQALLIEKSKHRNPYVLQAYRATIARLLRQKKVTRRSLPPEVRKDLERVKLA